MTNLDELKTAENLRDYADRNLRKSKGGLYCCPACGSGTTGSRNSDGALSLDGALWKCFSCGAGGSVIDLIMVTEGKGTTEAVKRTRELYDRDYDPNPKTAKASGKAHVKASKPQPPQNIPAATPATEETDGIKRDFRNYYKRCQKNIYQTDYTRQRGLNDESIARFNLGYDPDWISPTAAYKRKQENKAREKAGEKPLPPLSPSPRLIIPISRHNYLARDTRPDDELTDGQKKFKKAKEGREAPFFNRRAIENPLCFFIVEGELDAISIEQAGGSCLALGSTARAKACGDELKKLDAMTTGTVIIALDNDEPGQKATEAIAEACEMAGLDYVKENASGQYKDPNEFLVKDKAGFYKTISGIVQKIRQEKLADYERLNASAAAGAFMNRPDTAGEAIATGFTEVDKFLDGGLCHGLVFIGGLSSLGKTTLALQMAEYMATDTYPAGTQEVIRGRDVLYFALEQSKNDLISKILSRRTYIESQRQGKGEKLAKTNIELLQRNRWGFWNEPQCKTVWQSYESFDRTVGKNLYIVESPGDLSAKDIATITKRHIAITGRTPIVFIDYLQILKSIDEKATDKQAVDRTIVTLKHLSRDCDTAVIAISSFNRESYWQKASLSAFKESGNLEYSADILLAIAPAGVKEATGDKEKAENKTTTEVCKESKDKHLQLHVLKNRNGKTTGRKTKLCFCYHSWFNCFEEERDGRYDNFDEGNPAAQGQVYM